jgi:hypothetical protein
MTIDDPHDQTAAAAEEQPAGGTSTNRAELLGTTALTARLRCPCGKRRDVEREDWQWFGVTVCPRCGRGILHDSLRVVSRTLALSMIEERRPTEGELRALRRMELALRDFMLRYAGSLRWHWAPSTNSMADEVGRLLRELDRSRRERGAPPVVAGGRASLDEGEDGEAAEAEGDAAGEQGWAGDGEDDELLDEEEG